MNSNCFTAVHKLEMSWNYTINRVKFSQAHKCLFAKHRYSLYRNGNKPNNEP